jgi:serine/threonine protein kinase
MRRTTMPVSVDDLCSRLTTSKLLAAEEVESFLSSLSPSQRPEDGESFAALLVKMGKLTRFQAANLCAGTGEKLLLGNYVILDKLGQGGMGAVFKAQHRRMKRLVALKMISPSLVGCSTSLKRFQREVETLARLSHRNIVLAHDADEADGIKFLVMELVEGRDLASMVREQGPLQVTEAVDCIIQAARGLAYAHRQHVVHRDIKPSNILLDPTGTVTILDLGLASLSLSEREMLSDEPLTSSNTIVGTLEYMAPEQAQCPKSHDPRSDVYGLGLTLWFLLTGRVAYEAKCPVTKLLAHRDLPIPSLLSVRADVPPALDAIFRRMAAKQVSDRYQTMEEVLTDLENFHTTYEAPLHSQKATGLEGTAIWNPAGLRSDGPQEVTTPLRKNGKSKPLSLVTARRPKVPQCELWWQNRRLAIASAWLLGCSLALGFAIALLSGGIETRTNAKQALKMVSDSNRANLSGDTDTRNSDEFKICSPRISLSSIGEEEALHNRGVTSGSRPARDSTSDIDDK